MANYAQLYLVRPYMDSTYFTTLTLHKNVIASVYTASCWGS